MFIKQDKVNEFLPVEFQEHPVVNFKHHEGALFDISTKEFDNFIPSFIEDGKFSHKQYSICLINKSFSFSSVQLLYFIRYQCRQLSAPILWLEDFSTLLNLNQQNPLIKLHLNKLDLIRALLLEKWNQLNSTIGKRPNPIFSLNYVNEKRFSITDLKKKVEDQKTLDAKRYLLLRRRTDYLQEMGPDRGLSFINAVDMELNFLEETKDLQRTEKKVKKIVFNGSGRELATLFNKLNNSKSEDGSLIFEGSITDYSRLIANNYIKVKGESITEASIRRYLSKKGAGKETKTKPPTKKRIE